MRKLKKYLAIGCTAMMVVTAAGCSSTTTSSTATEDTTQEETTETTEDTATTDTTTTNTTTDTATTTDDSIVFGKVTAVEGTSITLAVGEMPQGKDMGNGEAPAATDATSGGTDTESKEAPSTDAGGAGGQAPSGEAPSGQAPSGEAPSGEAPSGEAPDMSSMFEESGETLTITVEDESLIKIMSGTESTTGSLSDITVDTILTIEYDDSDNITSITIQSAAK